MFHWDINNFHEDVLRLADELSKLATDLFSTVLGLHARQPGCDHEASCRDILIVSWLLIIGFPDQ